MQVFELPKPNNPPGSWLYSPVVLPESIAFSPDGRLLAAWNRGGVYVIDTVTGTARTLCADRDIGLTEVPGIGFTADGKGIIAQHSLHPGEALRVHDETGAVVREFPFNRFGAVEPGPGGRLVYVSVTPEPGWPEVVPWDPLTGETKPSLVRHKGFLRQLAVSADEKWLAGSSSDVVRVWNRSGPKPPARATRQFKIEPSIACVTALALSSDGAFVAASGSCVGVRVGDVRTGEMWRISQYSSDFAREIAFHPSRPLLAFSGGTPEVTFWDAAARAEVKRFAWEWGAKAALRGWRSVGKVLATAFSPDGLRCAAAAAGKIVVWDVDT